MAAALTGRFACGSGLAAVVLAVGDYLEPIHGYKPACTRHAASGRLLDAVLALATRRIVLDGLENKAISIAVPREFFASMLSGTIYGAVKEWLSSLAMEDGRSGPSASGAFDPALAGA